METENIHTASNISDIEAQSNEMSGNNNGQLVERKKRFPVADVLINIVCLLFAGKVWF